MTTLARIMTEAEAWAIAAIFLALALVPIALMWMVARTRNRKRDE